MVEYGVVGGWDLAQAASRAGYAFAETSVRTLLAPLDPVTVFESQLSRLGASPLPYPVLHGFVPPSLPILGPEAVASALAEYATITLERAEQAGIRIIVFGSGKARRRPEGVNQGTAMQQLQEFCAMAAGKASQHGVTIALEPLCQGESNTLNTVAECARLVRTLGHPSLRLLVDTYHFLLEGDRPEDLVANLDLLCHVHIGTAPGRLAPGSESCPALPTLLGALRGGGYGGRISIEATIRRPEIELPRALKLLQEWLS